VLGNEDTPLSVGMQDKTKLMILATGGPMGKMEPLIWFRSKRSNIEWSDYTNLSTEDWDALMFKAKRDVYFLGVGMMKNYDGAEFVLEIQYRVTDQEDGDDSFENATKIEVDSQTSPQTEDNLHWFDVQQYG